MLRGMLQETSTHLMGEQKKMLERLWDALMGNQRTATQMMGAAFYISKVIISK
jgi:hypothetical protein